MRTDQLYPLSISYEENSCWNNCTQGQFILTNESVYDITDWTIEITYNEEITVSDIWNAADITGETYLRVQSWGNEFNINIRNLRITI
ncbi:MAG: cellulose binding domain-containing protein [Clostridiales bacterium]|nr:cellulose binding domain-containing protein [Clostridiales bacterium]